MSKKKYKKYSALSFLSQRKLRVDILFIFVTLFIVSTLAIISYNFIQQTNSLLTLSKSLIQRTEQTAIQRIHTFLKPSTLAALTSHLLQDDTLNLSNQAQLESFMQGALRAHPELFSFYLADAKGNFIEELRLTKNLQQREPILRDISKQAAYVTNVINRIVTPPVQTFYIKNDQGRTIEIKVNRNVTYDPRNRPWFKGAKNVQKRYWIGAYRFYQTGQAGVTVAYPIMGKDGRFFGAVGTDFNLDAMTAFLKDIQIGKNGVIFVMNNKGQLISSSSDQETNALVSVDNLRDSRSRLAYQRYLKTKEKSFVFSVNNVDYIASFSLPFTTRDIGKWVVGIVVPTADFIKPVTKMRRVTLLFALGIVLFGTILIVFVSRNITRPITELAIETEKIKKLHLHDEITINTHIIEVQMMLDSITSMKKGLQSFSKYVPKELVQQLMSTGEVAKVGSQKKLLTVLFTDITDFTEVAETYPAEELAELLSEYLEVLTEIIKGQHGTIDKYIGDAIMSFWGAPIHDAKHVEHACMAALMSRQKIDELNIKWLSMQRPAFHTRFGIHTGDIIVGNMGSSDRINYTVIGDNVNLAARLEGINKNYGTQIIVSEAVYENVHEIFLMRPMDVVRVRGRQQTTLIYELMALQDESAELGATGALRELCYMTEKAFIAYVNKEWLVAQSLYETILNSYPDDPLAKTMLLRISAHLQ